MGLAAPNLWQPRATASPRPGAGRSFGQARSCILLFLIMGGPPQQ
jgi:hypothetical protein